MIDAPKRLVVSCATGVLSFADVLSHGDRLRTESSFEATFDNLLDLTAVTSIALTQDEVHEAARRSPFAAPSRKAIVAASSAHFGIGRMYEAYFDSYRSGLRSATTRVFQDRASACSWLGIA